jgi:hypothetical protein
MYLNNSLIDLPTGVVDVVIDVDVLVFDKTIGTVIIAANAPNPRIHDKTMIRIRTRPFRLFKHNLNSE